MNTHQKGFANIVLILAIVILVGIGGYFVFVKKSEPVAQQQTPTPTQTNTPVSPTPTPEDETANWKTYNNARYSYTIKYPSDWYVETTYSENDFTQRGPVGDNDFIGGDTIWSNYQNPRQYDLGTIPPDSAEVFLLIYRTDSQAALDSFISSRGYSYSKKENVNINGVAGIRLTIEDPENPENSSAISTIVLLKAGNNVFKFSYARNSAKSAIVMDQMLQNFELK